MNNGCFGAPCCMFWVLVFLCFWKILWAFACVRSLCLVTLLYPATVKKSIRLREEALAKEQVKATSSQTSADKLRKILKEEKKMKKKRKRSASSSSSDSTSSMLSSSSSSSSSRRRSRKKKKKRRRSERGSKRHRRISSRESRRSSESRSERGRKEREEEEEEAEELEWFPAQSNTSATFLNQKGGLSFEVRDEDEKDADDKRICQLYSLSAASEEESDSSLREGKKRDRKEDRVRKNSAIRSPERRSRSREKRDRSREREEDPWIEKKDSESKRRRSLDENQMQKSLCSSAEVEFSHKSSFPGSASKHLGNRMRPDSRNPLDDGRYENRERDNIRLVEEVKREKESAGRASLCEKPESAGNHNEQGARPKKDLPANLLNIFNQIAQFEKEKGVKPKK